MKTIAALFACCMIAGTAVDAARSTSISMYGSWINEDTYGEESEFGDLQPLTAWSVIDSRTNSRTHLVGVFAVDDRDKVVRLRDFRFHWKPKQKMRWLAPWLSEFSGGYLVPPFGREWSALNPFQIGAVRYSGISDSLVARDNGVQAAFVPVRGFSVVTAMFAGERRGGFAGERNNTHRHFYFQARRALLGGFVAGTSYRWSTRDRRPWALELTREFGRGISAFELVRVERVTEWYALAEYDIRRRMEAGGGGIRIIGRLEELRYGRRMVLGCSLFLIDVVTIKANYVHDDFPGTGNRKILLQGIAHQDF